MQLPILADVQWLPDTADLRLLGPLWTLVATIVALLIGALAVGRNWRVAGTITILGGVATVLLCVNGFDAVAAGRRSVQDESIDRLLLIGT